MYFEDFPARQGNKGQINLESSVAKGIGSPVFSCICVRAIGRLTLS